MATLLIGIRLRLILELMLLDLFVTILKKDLLNDQNDKRNINCDAKLKKLLKYDPADPKLPKDEKTGKTLPLTYFRLQQYLKHHFIKADTEELDN